MKNKPDKKIRVKRIPKRGHYDKETIYNILDAGYICHVGFIHEAYPLVIPTGYGREENTLYLHGSSKSRMMLDLQKGIDICVTVTHLDGLVLARSGFHHSMNYRSVVVFGKATMVEDKEEKIRGLKIISDQILAGRWEEVRGPNEKELKATTLLKISIDQASAKIREGGPGDEEADYALDVWAGVVPLQLVAQKPIDDPVLREGISLAESVKKLYDKKSTS